MSEKINLKQLEKNTTAQIFETGLVELGIGMIFIVSTLAMLFDDYRYYIDILFIVPVIFLHFSIRKIAQPRLGVVKYSKKRVNRSRYMFISITSFLIITVVLTFMGGNYFTSDIVNPRYIITAIIFTICFAVAFFMNFVRMYFYAFLISGGFLLSETIRENEWLGSKGGNAYLLVSVIIIAIGLVYFVKFIRNNPIPKEVVNYEK